MAILTQPTGGETSTEQAADGPFFIAPVESGDSLTSSEAGVESHVKLALRAEAARAEIDAMGEDGWKTYLVERSRYIHGERDPGLITRIGHVERLLDTIGRHQEMSSRLGKLGLNS